MKKVITGSTPALEIAVGTGTTCWYFTSHGVGPGTVPKDLYIFEVIDRPEGSYFATVDDEITEYGLTKYDIKKRVPKDVNYYKTVECTPGSPEDGIYGDKFDEFVVAANSIQEAQELFWALGLKVNIDAIEPATLTEFYAQ